MSGLIRCIRIYVQTGSPYCIHDNQVKDGNINIATSNHSGTYNGGVSNIAQKTALSLQVLIKEEDDTDVVKLTYGMTNLVTDDALDKNTNTDIKLLDDNDDYKEEVTLHAVHMPHAGINIISIFQLIIYCICKGGEIL